jgi:formimidoylglutamase
MRYRWRETLTLLLTSAAMCGLASAQTTTAKPEAPPGERVGTTPETLRPVTIPQDLAAKIPADARAYVESGRATRFVRPDDFFARIRKSTDAEVAAYLAALRSVADAVDFNPQRDKAAIPLDRASPEFNAWKARRPASLNPPREPGPITLGRYIGGGGGGGSGIPTFANAQVALTPEDLTAGKVDVAIVGAPLDMGYGYRDAFHGPLALRTGQGTGAGTGLDVFSQVNPLADLRVVDYGDVAVDNLNADRSVEHVREIVKEIAATGAIPFIIGGDHSLSYPNLAALAEVHGKGKIGVVHFDSHYDAARDQVHLIDHGNPVYRLISEGHVLGKHYVQVGLRARNHNAENLEYMRSQGMRYHTMVEVERRGWEAVMERAIAEAKQGTDKLFISFDVDVLDPAYVSGTGTPVPGGLTMREAQPIMRRLCAENNIVGIDLVEVAPYLDVTYRTAQNAAFIMNACLAGIAMRKKGLTQPHYLSPLSVDHGQDNKGADK